VLISGSDQLEVEVCPSQTQDLADAQSEAQRNENLKIEADRIKVACVLCEFWKHQVAEIVLR
jgi:hypothetical protein